MRADQLRYLKHAGFDFKPSESPDVWTHLESHFATRFQIGPKFTALSPDAIETLIAQGEDALLEAMETELRRTGKLQPVTRILDMPFVVGTDGMIPLAHLKGAEVIELIDEPGTPHEHVIHVLPASKDAIPTTTQVTVKGGVYADGHTVGYYDLYPGSHADALHTSGDSAWLATKQEIAALARDMEAKTDDIAVVTRAECEAMLARVRKTLGM